jgi:hypothetical protein
MAGAEQRPPDPREYRECKIMRPGLGEIFPGMRAETSAIHSAQWHSKVSLTASQLRAARLRRPRRVRFQLLQNYAGRG